MSGPHFDNVVELLRARARAAGERTAFRFLADGTREEESISYGALDERVRALAARLQQSALREERALLLYSRELDFIVAFLACLYAGVAAVPAYPPRNARGLPRLLVIARDARPGAILTTSALLPRIHAWWTAATGAEPPGHWIASDETPADAAPAWQAPVITPETLAFLQYTSGSTADPKGVMVSHANLLHNEMAIRSAFDQSESSVIVSWLPLFHDMGLIGTVLQPLYTGSQAVLMSPASFLQQPSRWLEAISRYRADTSGGPNFAFDLAVRKTSSEQREKLDLSCWRVAFNGAEPVQHGALERFVAAFEPHGFRREALFPCYGLAEATLLVAAGRKGPGPVTQSVSAGGLASGRALPLDAPGPAARTLVSSGRVADGMAVRIVNVGTGELCPPSEVGEIHVAGPSVAAGYWNQPEATQRVFRARIAGSAEPFLRTGDLGFMAGGELFVTGRLKDLIIVRGRNLYPQDIELTAAHCHPAIRPDATAVFALETDGEERLVIAAEIDRHLAAGQLPAVGLAVRQRVAEEHQIAIHALVLLRTGTLPRTSSGKIRRSACREAYLAGALEILWQDLVPAGAPTVANVGEPPPDGAAEPSAAELLAALRTRAARWLRLPGEQVDPSTPLSALGLDSLAAVELRHELEAAYRSHISFEELIAGHTLASLVEEILVQRGEGSPPAAAEAAPAHCQDGLPQPLSRGQRALWLADRQWPLQAMYNVAVVARAPDGIESADLERAFATLIARHESLRMTFGDVDGDPFLRIGRSANGWLSVEDATGWSADEIRTYLAAQAFLPFDLEHGPLLRLRDLRRAGGEHLLLFVAHHLIADFWSLSILVRELQLLCGRAPTPLPPLPWTYREHVVRLEEWLASERGTAAARYWEAHLAGAPTSLRLSADRPRPAERSHRGAAAALDLPAPIVDRLRALSAASHVSLFASLLTAFQALLFRHTGQEDLLVGVPSAGRARPEMAGVVGYFVNPLVLRGDLSGDPSFTGLLARNRAPLLGALAHQDFPFGELVERLRPEREAGASPLFQVLFSFQQGRPEDDPGLAAFSLGTPGAPLQIAGHRLLSLGLPERRVQFDLTLAIAPLGGGLRAVLEYDTDLFDRPGMLRLIDHFARLLTAAAAEPERRVSELPALSMAERAQLLTEWNAAPRQPAVDASLDQLFARQAATVPEAVAVAGEGFTVTYRELDQRSDRLARHLRGLGVGPEAVVGVALERTPDLIAALLGVLKAGGAYLPLDITYPRERLAFMMADAGCRALVSSAGMRGQLPETSVPMLLLGEGAELPDGPAVPGVPALPENLAYVLYTSGSTGRPKGVAVTHRSAVALIRWAHEVYPPDVLAGVLASTSISFDLSVFEIFVPLCAGGRVLLVENVLALPTMGGELDVRLLNTVPSLLAELLRGDELPPSLRVLNLAGEALPRSLVREIERKAPPRCRLFNLYGPSEDTTYSTLARVPLDAPPETDEDPAIGRPLPGTAAYVLDRHLQPVPSGVSGELFLAGLGLARGYQNQPQLTAERFLPDSFATTAGARCYRTGDRVRHLPDGTIEYLGRVDQQVKVRGLRIELGEIETAIQQHPEVRSAVVVARDTRGARRLVAYLVPRAERSPSPAELVDFLRRRLPGSMIPETFCALSALPLTPNGKVDRRALPEPWQEPVAAASPPQTAEEALLADVWRELLGGGDVGREDSFFQLGGNSLLSLRMLSRIRQRCEVELALNDVFEHPTLAALATRIELARQTGRQSTLPVVPAARGRELPLSFAQQALWLQHQLAPGSPLYNVAGAVRLEGELDRGALLRGLREVVRRHQALRTLFPLRDGSPAPCVAIAEAAMEIAEVDLSAVGRWAPGEARELVTAAVRRPFNLAHGPILRALLVRSAPGSCALALAVHHIACDGWSLRILLRDLGLLYTAFRRGDPSPLSPLSLQYADYAVWQRDWLRGSVMEKALGFWRQELAAAPSLLGLPTDRPRSPETGERGAALSFAFPPDLLARLQALCRARGATLFMALAGSLGALLSRLTGQSDLLLGSPVANRPRAELEPLIGCFINTVVLRLRNGGDPPFGEILRRTRSTALAAFAHGHLPFETLVEESAEERLPGGTPFFQVMLSFQEALVPELALPGLRIAQLPADSGTAKFDLTLDLERAGDRLTGASRYRTGLFERVTVERILGQWENLLTAALRDPDQRLSDLPILAAAERHQLLREADRTAPGGREGPGLHHLLAIAAEGHPERQALLAGDRRLSFRELNALASFLAARLIARGVRAETPVALFLERSPELVIALFAVLKAGAPYLPLDPTLPAAQLRHILADARASLVITRRSLIAELPPGRPPSLAIDEELAGCPHDAPADRGVSVAPAQLAYILYTSGSTGLPKGVAISHGSVTAYLQWVGEELLGEQVRCLPWITRLSFDASLKQLFHPLLHGRSVLLIEEETVADPELLLARLREAQGLALNCVPALWRSLLAALEARPEQRPRHLTTLLLGGESCTPELLARSWELFPGLEIWNVYGPTEATCNSSYRRLVAGAAVDLGGPVQGTKLYVLDALQQLAPLGVPGELAIGGSGLARGYLHRPDLTAERFVPDPWSALPGARIYRTGDRVRYGPGPRLELLGRLDDQVKVRGFRIEPGEIEATIGSHPGIAQCAVLALHDRSSAETFLGAFVVPAPCASLAAPELASFLRARLPPYMVPARFFRLAALPLTHNGKVDRQALSRGDWEDAALAEAFIAPSTPEEIRLATLWGELLGSRAIGLHDSFFALGGNSLLAAQALSRVRRDFGTAISLREFFLAPSIAGLAARLAAERTPGSALPEIVPVSRAGPLPLSLAQERFWFLDRLVPDSPSYSLPGVLDLTGNVDGRVLAASLAAVAGRHEVLRLKVIERGGRPFATFRPCLPPLPCVDLSGLPRQRAMAAADDLLRSEAQRPFDLGADPLLRAMLLRLGGGREALFINLHHIVADGWSIAVLADETAAHYRLLSGEPGGMPAELPIQYADYAVWQRNGLSGPLLANLLGYWQRQLAGTPDVLALPADRLRPPVQTMRGATCPLRIPAARLNALSQGEGVTLFITLLAAFEIVLWQHTGQEEMRVGSPVSNRNRPETEKLIGLFTNTLVFPGRVRGDETFSELLARTRTVVLGGLDHQDLPFEKLVESLAPGRDLSRNPLFLAMLVLENAPAPNLTFCGFHAHLRKLATRTAKVDLTLLLQEQGEVLGGGLEYSSDLFDRATVERFLRRLETTLEAVGSQPRSRLDALPAMPPSERHQVLLEWGPLPPPWRSRSSAFTSSSRSRRGEPPERWRSSRARER